MKIKCLILTCLPQIYLPCTLLVVLSWVGFFLNREATSDRVGLGEWVQGWAKRLALGCVNPDSWFPLAAGREFTQPYSPVL